MTRSRVLAAATATLTGAAVAVAPAAAAGPDSYGGGFSPGAPGVGDPYFPLDGNGGYDVRRYDLRLAYEPSTDELRGVATIVARATKDLSRFNLDLDGLEVRSVRVNGREARWRRDGGELVVTPRRGVREGAPLVTVVRYAGVPEQVVDPQLGPSGFLHTDDGALVAGQPHAASTWFPVNDHPTDKASYTFSITVPEGLEAVANGVLVTERSYGGRTTWVWSAREPMASYLTVLAIGEFDIDAYRADGVRYWDALDPDLFAVPEPRSGEQYALSGSAPEGPSYKRLARTIPVPADGAELSFHAARDTEADWDFMMVEARPAGTDEWTTLPDEEGHATQDTLAACVGVLADHPFLAHYLTATEEECLPSGTTGEWWAVSGTSDGYEHWVVDLSRYAGQDVEVAISYVSDAIISLPGVFVDDVVVSTGAGSTSFEDDGDPLDGWTVPGAPEGSPPNPGDWTVGTAADAPPSVGEIAEGSLGRQPEIVDFLSGLVGPYPFRAGGGIVDDLEGLGFALETQTRPVYSKDFFHSPESGDDVVVHEIAHQWFGDSLTLERWQHIWLNEGFATYAEWVWSEREGRGTAQEIFDGFAAIPADDPFWSVRIGDPGPEQLFDFAVYARGAMTLHALRTEMGDRDFRRLIRTWVRTQSGGHVTTPEFVRLAERVAGRQLDEFFDVWLFTAEKPSVLAEAAVASAASAVATDDGSRRLVTRPRLRH